MSEEFKGDETVEYMTGGVPEQKGEESKLNLRKTINLRPLEPIPEVEWWDAFFLPVVAKEGEVPKKFPMGEN